MVNRYKLNRALIKTNSNELLYGKSSIKCHLSDNQLFIYGNEASRKFDLETKTNLEVIYIS